MDNSRYLLIQILLPLDHGIEIVCAIGPLLGPQKEYVDDVPKHLFQRLPVLLIHGQQKGRNHDKHHDKGGGTDADPVSEQKEKRYADNRARREADKLPLCETEKHLAFDLGKVFGYAYISRKGSPRLQNIDNCVLDKLYI